MRRRKEPEEVRREQILLAAWAVAGREGIGGLTLRRLAAEAGSATRWCFSISERLVRELLE
jgi:AcrR family transcriptional regulator